MISDADIIDHYWQRDQRAISESDEKYGAYCRAVAMNIARRTGQAKRGGGLAAALEELGECVAGREDVQREVERRELVRAIDGFLARLGGTERRVFVSRYWHMAAVDDIARAAGFSHAKVTSMLHRTRKKLAAYLREEGLA